MISLVSAFLLSEIEILVMSKRFCVFTFGRVSFCSVSQFLILLFRLGDIIALLRLRLAFFTVPEGIVANDLFPFFVSFCCCCG